jgi:hypothetical protein
MLWLWIMIVVRKTARHRKSGSCEGGQRHCGINYQNKMGGRPIYMCHYQVTSISISTTTNQLSGLPLRATAGIGKIKQKTQPKYHLLLEELVLAPNVHEGVPTYGCERPEWAASHE